MKWNGKVKMHVWRLVLFSRLYERDNVHRKVTEWDTDCSTALLSSRSQYYADACASSNEPIGINDDKINQKSPWRASCYDDGTSGDGEDRDVIRSYVQYTPYIPIFPVY